MFFCQKYLLQPQKICSYVLLSKKTFPQPQNYVLIFLCQKKFLRPSVKKYVLMFLCQKKVLVSFCQKICSYVLLSKKHILASFCQKNMFLCSYVLMSKKFLCPSVKYIVVMSKSM